MIDPATAAESLWIDGVFAPIGVALLCWWLGAGAVLAVERGVPRIGGARFFISVLCLSAAIYAVAESLGDGSTTGAYLGFVGAIGIWGWHEVAFLSGWLTGPRRGPCPPTSNEWRRFRYASETVIHHEIALAATIAALAWFSWSAENQTAAQAFAVLWVMRLSAKLNLFFGVPNLAAAALPDELAHLGSYIRQRGVGYLFPTAVAGASLAAMIIGGHAAWQFDAANGVTGACVGGMLVATLLALAALEHVFMVLPLEDTLLWRWAFDAQEPAMACAPAETTDVRRG